MLIVRELGRETTQRQIGVREWRATPIANDRVHQVVCAFGSQRVVIDLGPEVVRVRLCSVPALQLDRHDGGEQLALKSAQR